MFKCTSYKETESSIIKPTLYVKKFAIMDIVEENTPGSSWRSSKSFVNFFDSNLFDSSFNISNIDDVIYNESKDTTTIVFDHLFLFPYIKKYFKAITFQRNFDRIKAVLLRSIDEEIWDIDSDNESCYSPKDIYKAFALLPFVTKECALITMLGEVYQTDSIQNYYNSSDINELGLVI